MGGKTALGEFEHQVLLAVVRLAGTAYTSSIVRELEERTGREVAAAAVYVALRRLESAGLARSEVRVEEARNRVRERRYFEATADGRALLEETRRRLERLWEGITPLVPEG